MDTASTSTNNTKLKSYLIEKLLNESTPTKAPTTNSKLIDSMKQRAESKEDLVSEAGTYTIDDSPDGEITINDAENNAKAALRQSTSTNVDLISARAAIDETFGIKRPQINDANNNPSEAELNSTLKSDASSPSKRSAQKAARARNQTYSLTKDLIGQQSVPGEVGGGEKSTLKPPNSSFSTSSSSSISSSAASTGLNDTQSESKLKKTMTYEVLATLSQEQEPKEANAAPNGSTIVSILFLLKCP
jgi:hypothetical protein